MTVKKLLNEIVPRFRLPLSMGSDNRPAFVAPLTQEVVSALNVPMKLQCAYRPQSSSQVERMNQTLRETLIKLTLETGEGWVQLLHLALLWVRCTPYILKLTPFEILFGRPPHILPRVGLEKATETSNQEIVQSLQSLKAKSTLW